MGTGILIAMVKYNESNEQIMKHLPLELREFVMKQYKQLDARGH